MSVIIAAKMTEDELQEHVRTLCQDLGLEAQHINDSRRCWLPGWPDITVLGGTRILYRELKSEHGSLSPEQRHVGSLIARAGASWSVWRPRDLVNGTISRQLGEITGRPGRTDPGPCYGPDCDHVSHQTETG